MQRSSPLARLSLRVHQSRQRRGLTGVAQRLALVVLPAPPSVAPANPILPTPELVMPEQNAARDRARRALIEARRTMSGVIGEEVVVADLADESMPPAITPDWEQLQAYLEESERERAALKEELAGLRDVVRVLQSRLDDFERSHVVSTDAGPQPSPEEAAPAIEESENPPGAAGTPGEPKATEARASATESPPEPETSVASVEAEEPIKDTDQVREQGLHALRDRVFAAGTIGTKVIISPTPDEPARRAIIERLNDDPLVEHAESVNSKEDDAEAALIRVTLRAPMRWEQFGALLERALDRPISQGDVRWSQGAVRVHLPSEQRLAGTEPRHHTTMPCA
jgi:hypothetical protein